MKRAQLLGLTIAAIAGILAFIMVRSMGGQTTVEKRVEVEVNAVEVLVARRDISLGEITNDGLFRWQKWPKKGVTPSFVTRDTNPRDLKKLYTAIVRAPILANEPITKDKLVAAGQGGVLAAILPKGMRAISTRIKEETSVGRLILPNDHVDVILISRSRDSKGKEEYISDTLFKNVRVLAIGQQLESKDGKKTTGAANTATLELTPSQAEMLAMADSMGDITLALRSVADFDPDGDGPKDGTALNKKEATGNSVRMLRYGVSSRAYGVR
jgi:pilus assembly protein CpaB